MGKSTPLSIQIIRKKHLEEEFYDLLSKVLRYSPKRRLSPLQALQHPFFDELRNEEVYCRLKKEYGLGELFDFGKWGEAKGQGRGEVERLVPKWWRG